MADITTIPNIFGVSGVTSTSATLRRHDLDIVFLEFQQDGEPIPVPEGVWVVAAGRSWANRGAVWKEAGVDRGFLLSRTEDYRVLLGGLPIRLFTLTAPRGHHRVDIN